MASGLSVYSANIINNLLLRTASGTAFTKPDQYWIMLMTGGGSTLNALLRADNLASAVSYEVSTSGTAYARLQVDGRATGGATGRIFSASSSGLSENTATWAFAECTATWNTVTTGALVDVSSGSSGHIWYWADLTANKLVSPPDIFRFLTGAFDVQM